MAANLNRSLLAPLIATALPMARASADAPRINWHAPATPEERALDAILKRVDRDDNRLDNLLGDRGLGAFHPTIDDRSMLTQRLRAAIRRAEADEVKRNYGGKYIDGELCGLDFLPIECTQDWNEKYVYHTELQNEQEAKIAYAWPWDNASPVATYKLVRLSGKWKIDRIDCGMGTIFNMQ